MGDAATAGSLTAWNDHTLDECRWCPARTSFATSCTPLAYYYSTLDFSALSDKVPSVNPSGNQEHGHRTPTLSHWRMPLLFLVLALLRGFMYAAVIPPWQSPDEHGHFEYAWLISQHGPFVGPESISPEFQQRVLESMARYDFWQLVHQPTPEALPSGFTDPSEHTLSLSRPQVGDERPLYYLLVGGLLWLTGVQDVVVGMYIGRLVSVLLYATAVGLTALTTTKLFPRSSFMQTVPPGLVLFLPMLGQMGAAVNSDSMGVLTSTLFFASLASIFQDGLTWPRAGTLAGALVMALSSKKTALFLIPTLLIALPVYAWTRRVNLPRRGKLALVTCVALLIISGIVLGLVPGGDAANWIEWPADCGPIRTEKDALEGKAALQVGDCADLVVQTLPQETAKRLAGRRINLEGWVRTTAEQATGQVSIEDNEKSTQVTVTAGRDWQSFTLTHTVDTNVQWVAVRLTGGESEEALLFDDLKLSAGNGENLLVNGSTERQESLLLDLISDSARLVKAPRRLVERAFTSQAWSLEALQGYKNGMIFCFHSFWGNFGWLALPLPSTWYWTIELACLLSLIGNLIFLIRKPKREGLTGYILTLAVSTFALTLQTFLPLISLRETYWLPQGRYLFPGVFAVVVLLAWGTCQVLANQWKRLTTTIAIGTLAAFDLCCLGILIVPHFWRPI
jgi:hypothetical protein